MNTTLNYPVQFTEPALTELKRLAKDQTGNQYLRVGVKGGGCSGMTYILEYDDQKEGDELYDIDGLNVIVSKSHEMYLLGMTIEFDNGLNSRGFTFKNPNASSTCGCGTSFAV